MSPALQGGVQVKCKRCGKPAGSNEFTLDPVYGMMVCRKCVEERRLKANPVRAPSPALKPSTITAVQSNPVKAAPVKAAPKPTSTKLVSEGSKTKQKCRKCGYSFMFDNERGYPRNCPNCSTPISSNYNFF